MPWLRGERQGFKALREKSTQGDLTVGVIGITSSGKSAFLNALMGERTVLVSSKFAKDGFGDPRSEAWKESGFEAVLAHLKLSADQFNHLYMVEAFSRRIEKELARER